MKFGLLRHSFSSGYLGVGALSISNMLLILSLIHISEPTRPY